MNKTERHKAIAHRAERALCNLYHNATPRLPNMDEKTDAQVLAFFDWLQAVAQQEIDYINEGAFTWHYGEGQKSFNNRKFRSTRANVFYYKYALQHKEEEQGKGKAWQKIVYWGTVRQYGHGGRTLAPVGLMLPGGSPNEAHFAKASQGDLTEAIQVIESFNAYVKGWCEAVPEAWKNEELSLKEECEA